MQGKIVSLFQNLRLVAAEVKVKVTQSCPTLCNPMDSTVHGILQARILEWVAIPFSSRSSQPGDQTQVSHITGRFFTSWATRVSIGYILFSEPSAGSKEYLSSVQLLSRVRLFATPWTAAPQASLSITNSRSSLKLMCIESVIPSSHLILCHPLLLLPPIPPSIRVFSSESALYIRWPKYWTFSFSISPSNEYSGLISFKIDWLDLLAVQGTLQSILINYISIQNF